MTTEGLSVRGVGNVTRLVSDEVFAPPRQYSHASAVAGGVGIVFLAGQIGRQQNGDVPDSTYDQTLQAFANVALLLSDLETGCSGILKTNIFLTKLAAQEEFFEARRKKYEEWFPEETYPSSTLVVVDGLADERAHVEIDVVAVLEAAPRVEV